MTIASGALSLAYTLCHSRQVLTVLTICLNGKKVRVFIIRGICSWRAKGGYLRFGELRFERCVLTDVLAGSDGTMTTDKVRVEWSQMSRCHYRALVWSASDPTCIPDGGASDRDYGRYTGHIIF